MAYSVNKMPAADHKYLPNLDPLRFFAAATVLFYHVDQWLVANGYKSAYLSFFPFKHGDIAVVFFFVLSGFLITFLLLKEKKKTGAIAVKTFYLKRIFRIWPLYFLVIILSFSFFNYNPWFHFNGMAGDGGFGKHLLTNAILLILICPNVVLLGTSSLGYANPTWSIGVEEQFYLIWPWIIRRKNYLTYIIILIVSMYLLSSGFIGNLLNIGLRHHWLAADSFLAKVITKVNAFFTFSASFRIDAMGIGALGAYFAVNQKSILQVLYSKTFQVFTYLVFLAIMLSPHTVPYQFYSVVFMVIIVNVSTNPATVIRLASPMLNYFGKISYGIYMYHLFLVIPSIRLVVSVFHLPVNIASEILIGCLALAFTIIVATISYHTFEKIFLRIKSNLTTAKKLKPVISQPGLT